MRWPGVGELGVTGGGGGGSSSSRMMMVRCRGCVTELGRRGRRIFGRERRRVSVDLKMMRMRMMRR